MEPNTPNNRSSTADCQHEEAPPPVEAFSTNTNNNILHKVFKKSRSKRTSSKTDIAAHVEVELTSNIPPSALHDEELDDLINDHNINAKTVIHHQQSETHNSFADHTVHSGHTSMSEGEEGLPVTMVSLPSAERQSRDKSKSKSRSRSTSKAAASTEDTSTEITYVHGKPKEEEDKSISEAQKVFNELAAEEEGEAPVVDKNPLLKFYTMFTEQYNFREKLDYYVKVETRIMPKDMKYIMDYRPRPIRDKVGKVMKMVYKWALHPLLDKMVIEFCQNMGITETTRVSSTEDRIFAWYSRERMLSALPTIKADNTRFIGNWINWDHMLVDHQCMMARLAQSIYEVEQVYLPHYCDDQEKIKQEMLDAGDPRPPPKLEYVERQMICDHVFDSNTFNPCTDKDCPQHKKVFCKCFKENLFVQPFYVLATKVTTNDVIEQFKSGKFKGQRWYVKAANLKGGNGIQFIDNADELESFFRYDQRRHLRGQMFTLQRCLGDPMLHENKRFDLQMFLLITVLTEHRVMGFLHPGYVRMAQENYDPKSCDLRSYFTDVMLFDPDYNRYKDKKKMPKEDYCVPYNDFAKQIGLPLFTFYEFETKDGKELDPILRRIFKIAAKVTEGMDSVVYPKPCTWQLFNMSIALESDKSPWLMGIEKFPSFKGPDTNSETQNKVVPAVLAEALTISFELMQRDFLTRSEKLWMDIPDVVYNNKKLIHAQQNFAWVYSTPPEKMYCYATKVPKIERDWYWNWRNNEDMNEYVLYLKNYRIANSSRDYDDTPCGRKTFGQSPIYILKKKLLAEEKQKQKAAAKKKGSKRK